LIPKHQFTALTAFVLNGQANVAPLAEYTGQWNCATQKE